MSSPQLIRSLVVCALVFIPGAAAAGNSVPPGQAPPVNVSPPTISGAAQLGKTLTAATGSWTAKFSLTFAYQWRRCGSTGASCASIAGAGSTTYAPVSADVGYTLRVVVTASDRNGATSATSAATAVVAPPPATPPSNTALPTISGTAVQGQTLSASSGSWSGTTPFTYAYQWQRCGTSCAAISGATGAKYLLVAADVGSKIRVAVKASNSAASATATSAATAIVAAAPPATPPSNTSPPTIGGTARQGQTLSASAGSWSGTSPFTYAYQWQRCGSSCAAISGATGATYALLAVDVGSTIRVSVRASNTAGSATATSAATASVAAVPIATPTTTAGSPYWVGDFRTGAYCQYATVFEATSVNSGLSPWGGLPACPNYTPYAQSTSQRVYLTHSPAPPTGTASTWISHQELRTTDGPWYSGSNLDKSTIRLTTQQTLNGSAPMGQTRWFRFSVYLPNPGFNWPASGNWYDLMDLHNSVRDSAGHDWPTLETMITAYGNPRYLAFQMDGVSAKIAYEEAKLLQLTDAAGNRVASAFNRWHTLIVGVKFSDQGTIGNSPGRVTIYFDGSLAYDKARPTVWKGETGVWLQLQNYKLHTVAFVNGATSSTIDFADVRIGYTKADVGG